MTTVADSSARGRVARTLARARKPDRALVEKLRERVPYWFVVLVLFGFAVLQIALNPFGFSDLTQRYAQDVSNLLISGPHLYPTTGRDQVSVALIEEESLHTLQMPWPWNYSAHKQVLDAILAYKPKAVVVDFLFVDSRPDASLPDLVDEIARYKKAGVPLYFEGGTDLPYGESPLRPELANTGVPILDPTINVYDGVVRQYPTTGHCFNAKGLAAGDCPSLALRVFSDVYPKTPLVPLKDKIELVWGTKTEPTNLKWRKYHDEDGVEHPCTVQTGFILRIWRAFFDKSTAQNLCPYNGIVPVESLIRGDQDPDVTNLLTNRVVFYGASLEGAQDKSYTPVNGLQANVFVHAMALDNLISFNGDPEQNVVTIAGTTLSSNEAQMLAIIPVILILAFLHMRRIHARKPEGEKVEHSIVYEWFVDKGIENLWHWLGFFLGLSIGILLAYWVGLSVANWVEVVFISVELAAMLLIGVPDSFWGYLHHVAGGVPDSNQGRETP